MVLSCLLTRATLVGVRVSFYVKTSRGLPCSPWDTGDWETLTVSGRGVPSSPPALPGRRRGRGRPVSEVKAGPREWTSSARRGGPRPIGRRPAWSPYPAPGRRLVFGTVGPGAEDVPSSGDRRRSSGASV